MASPTPHIVPRVDPADTVQRFPTLADDIVRLTTFDARGKRQLETKCHRDVADRVSEVLLALTRELYPNPASPAASQTPVIPLGPRLLLERSSESA